MKLNFLEPLMYLAGSFIFFKAALIFLVYLLVMLGWVMVKVR